MVANAYADDVTSVEVNTFPFEITLVEEGTVIITSDIDRTLRLNGVFTIEVKAAEPFNLVLSPLMDSDNTDGWYVQDLATGEYNIIHTVDPYVAPPPEPVYVAPVYVAPVYVEPVIQEPIQEFVSVEVVSSSATSVASNVTSSSTTGIYNVATYEGEVDLLTMQTKLAEVTLKFNESIITIASLQDDLTTSQMSSPEDLIEKDNTINALIETNSKLGIESFDFSERVDLLEAEKVNWNLERTSLESERDQWKQLANNWYAVAMEQLEVMVNVLGL
jgi:hypothetical protein